MSLLCSTNVQPACSLHKSIVGKFFRKLAVRFSRHSVYSDIQGYTEAVGHKADPGALCLKMHAGHKIVPDQTISLLHSNLKAIYLSNAS